MAVAIQVDITTAIRGDAGKHVGRHGQQRSAVPPIDL